MAIQFPCPGCSQPIEVDDVYAGQTAACPYCRRVVNVPAESILDESRPVVARPAAGAADDDSSAPSATPDGPHPAVVPPPPPATGELHVGPALSYRDQLARTYGNYALICTGIMIVLMVSTMVYSLLVLPGIFEQSPASQPSVEQVTERIMLNHPWLIAGPLGAMFFAVVGLALGITSVKQTARGNWRGIVSLVICALFVLCFCGINGVQLLGGGLTAPACLP
ncbi:MAG: hypothetical protein ACE5I3_06055 [Phycisphaerae bacterium]